MDDLQGIIITRADEEVPFDWWRNDSRLAMQQERKGDVGDEVM